MRVIDSRVNERGENVVALNGLGAELLKPFDGLRCAGYEWMIGEVKQAGEVDPLRPAVVVLCPTEFPPPIGASVRRAEEPLTDEEIDAYLGMLGNLHRQLKGLDLPRLNSLFNVVNGTGPTDEPVVSPRAREMWPTRPELTKAFTTAWEFVETLARAIEPLDVVPVVNPANCARYLGEIGTALKAARDVVALASARAQDASAGPAPDAP